MTVLVFDGKTLAADMLASSNGTIRTVRKIARLRPGLLAGFTGDLAKGLAMLEWLRNDAIKPFPDAGNLHSNLWVIAADASDPRGYTIVCYEDCPFPSPILDAAVCAGSGGPVASGALAMGADARRAVEIACDHETDCGQGIDWLTL